MERYELPEGWEWVTIGNKKYFSLIMGQSPPSRSYNIEGKGLPFFQGKAEFGEMYPKAKKFCTEPSREAEKDDILISVRAPVGPTNIADQKCCIGRGLAAIRCTKNVLPKYMIYALRSIATEIAGSVQDQGGGFTAIKRNQLETVEIPVPPLDEQRRIVARIDVLTRRVEEAKRLRQDAIKEAKNYLPSAIDRAFSENDSTRWRRKKVRALCEKPQYGYTESAIFESVGPKFLRITDIQDGKVNWEDVPFCRCDEVKKYKLRKGDIVFARTGATTGKSYLIEQQPDHAIFASYLIRLRPKEEIAPGFLYWYFQSSLYWRSIFAGVEDGNRPNMNGSKLGNIEIPYPQDKTEQRSIVNYLNSLRAKVEELARLQAEADGELAAFTPALLAKAFRGEL